jgi:hypothetical protein
VLECSLVSECDELFEGLVKQVVHRGVIGEHQTTHLVGSLHVGTLLAEGHLDGGGSPFDEIGKFPLTNSLQRFVNLTRIHLSLDDVQNGDV